jgi:hypothetical protein
MKLKLLAATFFSVLCFVGESFGQPAAEAKYNTLSVDMGQPGCEISTVDFYGGHLESGIKDSASYWVDAPPVRSSVGDFSINFKCQINKNSDDVAHAYGASWNSAEKAWMPYYQDANDQKILAPASKIYQLKSSNAVGFLRTTDQVTGDEDQRVRFYSFCLFHGEEAVCGDGQSMRLAEPKGNYLPYILRVLRSVTFSGGQKDGTAP